MEKLGLLISNKPLKATSDRNRIFQNVGKSVGRRRGILQDRQKTKYPLLKNRGGVFSEKPKG
jgi:hypothetical protein